MADYPKKFEEFWKAYPRKVAKIPALRAWEKQGVEDDLYNAKAAIDNLEKRTRFGWWSKDRSKIPHPASWINAQRWHDEGWEDDIPGHDKRTEAPKRKVQVPAEPERIVAWQEAMLNRIFLSYCMRAGGLSDAGAAIKIRDRIMDETVPNLEQELRQETMTQREVAMMLAELWLSHLDAHYQLDLRERILSSARRAADRRY